MFIVFWFILLVVSGCQEREKVADVSAAAKEAAVKAAQTKDSVLTSPPSQYLVQKDEFYGVRLMDNLAQLQKRFPGRLQKSEKKTGEGDFDIFKITGQDGEHLGNIYPDPQNEAVVGQIEITSPKAVTQEGIRLGDTFHHLRKTVGALEVHGSEIEGRTYASRMNIYYRLDMVSFTPDLDQNKIDPDVKILEFVIR